MLRNIRRVAIVNRGEPAARFIRGVRDYNRNQGTDIRTLILFTAPDRLARFVQEADEALNIGAATFTDPRDGQRKPTYLDLELLAEVLVRSGVDAAWTGWGFVAERPEFVELCQRLGLLYIGPDSGPMRTLGDKISAKLLAAELGVPVTPWCGCPAPAAEAALEQAARLGYPVAIKATAGEGGRGIRKVESKKDLAGAFLAARNEAARFLGNPTLFVERWLEGVRHVEVQTVADAYGAAWRSAGNAPT